MNFYFYYFCFFKRRTADNTFDVLLSSGNERTAEVGNDVNMKESESEQRDLLWECRGLALLPLNLMVVRIWGTTRFWIDISIDANSNLESMEYASLVLLHFQSIGDSSLPFFNFVLLAIVKWTQMTEAYPWLKHFRPCQWLGRRDSDSLLLLSNSHQSSGSRRSLFSL